MDRDEIWKERKRERGKERETGIAPVDRDEIGKERERGEIAQ